MNESFFAKAFEKSAVGMAFLQEDGKVLSANPALLRILNKDLWLIVGNGLDAHLKDDHGERWRQFFQVFVEGRATDYYFESPFEPRENREAWWSLQLGDLEMLWSGQRVLFVLVEDITLKKLNERQLREARRQAEAASRAKSQFLANMSHEIRTPLFTITGMTELLLSGRLNRDQTHYARQIDEAAGQLLDLVNDVLDLSKIEAGQMPLETIPFDLDTLLATSLGVVRLAAFRKGLELVLDVDPSVPHLWLGDPGRLRQVLVNLLSNAVKFTDKGFILVRVHHQEIAGGREMLHVRVEDTGMGITPAAEETLFQAFSQGDSSTTRKFGGTGLGLAISQRLVRMQGGEIGYHSEKNHGTEFYFSVALQRRQDPELAWGSQGRGREVWLVEDHEVSRQLWETYLRWADFRVRSASNSAEVLKLWEDRDYRLPAALILDEDLGGEDGLRVWSQLHQQGFPVSIPLVLLRVLPQHPQEERYPVKVEPSAILEKPVNPRSLVEALTTGLDGLWQKITTNSPAKITGETRPVAVKIALAEDNDINRELFQVLLSKLGCEIFSAVDGEEILETVRTHNPDLVFMDIQMPKLNGYEAASRLRHNGVRCPIVAVTASALKGELDRCLRSGMNGVLTKPFKLADLREILGQFLPGRGPFLEVEQTPQPLPVVTGPVIFDWDEAQSVFLGNRDLVLNLLRRFIPRTRESLQRLIYALELQDLEQVAQAAHAIKGSALNLTAKALGYTASEAEKSAREGDASACTQWAEKLTSDLRDFEAVVTPFLKS